MEPTPQQIDLFDRYLRNEMQEEEKVAFLDLLKSEAETQKQFEAYNQTLALIELAEKEALKKRIHEKGKVQYFRNQWGKTWNVASAAIILLFIGLYWFVETQLPEKLLQPKDTESYSNNEAIESADSGSVELAQSETKPKQTKSLNKIVETDVDKEVDIGGVDESINDLNFDSELLSQGGNTSKELIQENAAKSPQLSRAGNRPEALAEAETTSKKSTQDVVVAQTQVLQDSLFTCLILTEQQGEWMVDNSRNYNLRLQLLKSPLNYRGYESPFRNNPTLSVWGLQPSDIKRIWVIENSSKIVIEIIIGTKDNRFYTFIPNHSQYSLPLIQDENRKKTLIKLNEN